jgi:hypothetical protein
MDFRKTITAAVAAVGLAAFAVSGSTLPAAAAMYGDGGGDGGGGGGWHKHHHCHHWNRHHTRCLDRYNY